MSAKRPPPSPSTSTRSSPRLAASSPLFGQVNLFVPHDFDLPPLYTKADPPVVAEALRLGAEAYKTVVAMKSSDEAHAFQAQHDAEIQQIRDQAAVKERAAANARAAAEEEYAALVADHRAAKAAQEQKIAQLQDALQNQKSLHEQQRQSLVNTMSEAQTITLAAARAEERSRTQAQLEAAMNQLKEDMATKDARIAAHQAHIRALSEQQQQLQASRDTDIQRAEERTQRAANSTMEEIQKTVDRLEREKERVTQLLETQAAALNALTEQLHKKPTSSKAKGDAYEEQMGHELYDAFGMCEGYELAHTASRGMGHEADFFMKLLDNKIMWEFKWYSGNVETKEVTKLYRDIRENPDISIAVMVSKDTKIVGKTSHGDLEIEFYNGVMCIFMSRYERMTPGSLKMLLLVFRLFWQNKRSLEMDDSKQAHMRIILDLQKAAMSAKTDWRLHKSRMEETVRWMGKLVDENDVKLQNAINILNGSALVEAPVALFKECAGNEKDSALVQKILRVSKVEPGGSLFLNDLAERVKGDLTAATVAKHIRSVLLPDVVEQKQGEKIRVHGLTLHAVESLET